MLMKLPTAPRKSLSRNTKKKRQRFSTSDDKVDTIQLKQTDHDYFLLLSDIKTEDCSILETPESSSQP